MCKSLGVSLPEWKQPLIVLKSEYTTSEELPPRVTVGDSESCDIVVSSKDKPASNLDDVKCNAEPKEIAVKTEQLSGAFNEHKGAQLADGCKQNGHNQSSKACEYQAPSGTLLECSQTYSQEVGAENSSCWTASCCDDDAVQGVKRKHEGDDVA